MSGDAPTPLLPFVQLEFTHAIGVPEGCYVMGTSERQPHLGGWLHTLNLGDGDCLQVETVEAPAAAPRRRRKAHGVDSDAAPHPVPLAVATLVLASRALPDSRAAQDELRRLSDDVAEQDRLRDLALAVLNRAARAFRVATTDPYVTDITPADPRIVRLGYGAPGDIGAARWHAAVELVEPRAPHRSPSTGDLRVYEIVAAAVTDGVDIFEAEELALRALLDLAHGRMLAAAAQARAAVEVLKEELQRFSPGAAASVTPVQNPDPSMIQAMARDVLETAAAYREAQLRGEFGDGRPPSVAALDDG